MKLIGRKDEIQVLDRLHLSDKPELLVVYGRRRVGKTFLIRQHFVGKITFDFVGSNGESSSVQLANFNRAFEDQCTDIYGWATDWSEAFYNLARYTKDRLNKKEKLIIFLDEFPWMDKPKSGFLSAFEYFWNQYGSNFPNLLFIICGSVSSWIIKNILKNYGGLHNRVTQSLVVTPFTLKETEDFVNSKNLKFTRSQIIQLYLALGGIPYYLDMIPKSMSVPQVLDFLFFKKSAPLRLEFNNLYGSLFKNPSPYISVIRVLSEHHYGLPIGDILAKSGLPSGGTSHRVLAHLEEGGFIKKIPFFGKKNRESVYRLIDFYSLFYLKFIEKMQNRHLSSWVLASESSAYKIWCGYAYENLWLLHYRQLLQALGISDVQTFLYSWRIPQNENTAGAQIDLIIDRKDGITHLCEVKFNEKPLVVSKEFVTNLATKRSIFGYHNPTPKAVVTTLLTLSSVLENAHFHQEVYSSVDLDGLF